MIIQNHRPRVLISEPNAPSQFTLPYMWAVLKTDWEHRGRDPQAFEWLDPIYDLNSIKWEMERLATAVPDVVGLSCYTWNWELQLTIGRRAKELNPRCLVVAGGPHPDYKDPAFFRNYPFIDCIVVKDGEVPFTQILDAILRGDLNLRNIPGLYLPALQSGEFRMADAISQHHFTGAAAQPESFEFSPYIEQSAYYERILAKSAGRHISLTWETNRGCPYGCSYCDWGSATLSKVRQFSLSRIESEADWIGRMKVNFLLLADANFGILSRDVAIAGLLAKVRTKYSYPKHLYYSPAKNNPDRTVDIARRFFECGLANRHVLAVQHTDPDVLRATDRQNIPASRYREVVRKIGEAGISAEAQMILGIPADTPARWKSCLAELMNWGVHERYQVSPYALLPNAPAAHPDFMRRWKIETIERELVPFEGFSSKQGRINPLERLIVASSSFTRAEWVEMNVYTAFLLAYHNRAIVRLPVFYLHYVHGVPFREVNDAIYDDFCSKSTVTGPLFKRVWKLYHELANQPGSNDAMELDEVPEAAIVINPSRWVFAKTMFRAQDFYRELTEFLVHRYPKARHLRSAMTFQENIAIDPGFDWREGRTFQTDCDWVTFVRQIARRQESSCQPEPESFWPPRLAVVGDHELEQRDFLRFSEQTAALQNARWVAQILPRLHISTFGVFSEVKIESKWSGREDSNLRPPGPEPGALPDCATPRIPLV